jgi:hypothetical protein
VVFGVHVRMGGTLLGEGRVLSLEGQGGFGAASYAGNTWRRWCSVLWREPSFAGSHVLVGATMWREQSGGLSCGCIVV